MGTNNNSDNIKKSKTFIGRGRTFINRVFSRNKSTRSTHSIEVMETATGNRFFINSDDLPSSSTQNQTTDNTTNNIDFHTNNDNIHLPNNANTILQDAQIPAANQIYSDLQNLSPELFVLEQNFNENFQNLHSSINQLFESVISYGNEINNMKSNINNLTAYTATNNDNLEACKNTLRMYSEQLNDNTNNISTMDGDITIFRNGAEQTREKIKEITSNLNALSSNLNNLCNLTSNMYKVVIQQGELLMIQSDRLNTQNQQIANLSSQVTQLLKDKKIDVPLEHSINNIPPQKPIPVINNISKGLTNNIPQTNSQYFEKNADTIAKEKKQPPKSDSVSKIANKQ